MRVTFRDNSPTAIAERQLQNKRLDEGLKELQQLDVIANLYWTFETVKDYFTENPLSEGDELIIHDTAGLLGKNKYTLVTVLEASRGQQNRIVVSPFLSLGEPGQSFYRSGKNCASPTGQVTLKPYHSIIGQIIKDGNGQNIKLSCREIEKIIGSNLNSSP